MRRTTKRIAVLLLLAASVGIGLGLGVYFFPGTTVPGRVLYQGGTGKAAIGGDFELTTTTGDTFTQENLKGKWTLVYFGYTFCPDICPMALTNITKSMEKLSPDDQRSIQLLFITIDPQRDTATNLASFIKNFHPNWIALTGTQSAIDKAKKAYAVYSAVVDDDAAATPYYLMDHSSIVYIMNPQGEYEHHLTHATPPDEILSALTTLGAVKGPPSR